MKIDRYVSAFLCLGALAANLPSADAHTRSVNKRPGAKPFGPELSTKFHLPSDTLDSTLHFFTPPVPRTQSRPLPTESIVADFLKTNLGFSNSDFVIKNPYTSDHNKVTHVYVRQIVNGLPVVNADININIDAEGRVMSFGDSFYRGRKPRPPVNDPNIADSSYPLNGQSTANEGADQPVNFFNQKVFVDKGSKVRIYIRVTNR